MDSLRSLCIHEIMRNKLYNYDLDGVPCLLIEEMIAMVASPDDLEMICRKNSRVRGFSEVADNRWMEICRAEYKLSNEKEKGRLSWQDYYMSLKNEEKRKKEEILKRMESKKPKEKPSIYKKGAPAKHHTPSKSYSSHKGSGIMKALEMTKYEREEFMRKRRIYLNARK